MSTAVALPPAPRPTLTKAAPRAVRSPQGFVPPVPVPTGADWWESIGRVPLDRVLFDPPPGTATVDDVLRLMGKGHKLLELVNGTLVEKPVGYFESVVAANILTLLVTWAKPKRSGVVSGADGTLRMLMGNVRIPDVAFIRREDLPEGGLRRDDPIPRLVPTLAVEVLSASNTPAEIAIKLREYFASGTKVAWVFNPADRTARVHDSPDAPDRFRQLTDADAIDGGDLLPGFSASVGELFEV